MIPKVKFNYSWPYEKTWEEYAKKYPKKVMGRNPGTLGIIQFIGEIEPLWKKEECRILKEISKIAGLKWKNREITCYIVGECIPMSDPLTMPVIRKYPNWFIDVLTHELIHRIFNDNNLEEKDLFEKLYPKYKKEDISTRNHVLIHAIHKQIYLIFFGEIRLKEDIRLSSRSKPYARAWEIVEKEGHEKIIEKLRKFGRDH